jgi:serine O-acetyltransferase
MMFKGFLADVDAIIARDPAARSRLEVILCYSGLHALLFHRVAHWLWAHGLPLLGRMTSQLGRWFTGIEIHPGANIGRRLFIDHGMGTVIGETSVIGDDVTLYHGVTLGGIAPSINSSAQVNRKRHPTLADGAIVGAGAQILGAIVVGRGARVGANAVVVKDVPAGETVAGIPARAVGQGEPAPAFLAYGTSAVRDPLECTVEALCERVAVLTARLEELEKSAPPAVRDGAETIPFTGRARSSG